MSTRSCVRASILPVIDRRSVSTGAADCASEPMSSDGRRPSYMDVQICTATSRTGREGMSAAARLAVPAKRASAGSTRGESGRQNMSGRARAVSAGCVGSQDARNVPASSVESPRDVKSARRAVTFVSSRGSLCERERTRRACMFCSAWGRRETVCVSWSRVGTRAFQEKARTCLAMSERVASVSRQALRMSASMSSKCMSPYKNGLAASRNDRETHANDGKSSREHASRMSGRIFAGNGRRVANLVDGLRDVGNGEDANVGEAGKSDALSSCRLARWPSPLGQRMSGDGGDGDRLTMDHRSLSCSSRSSLRPPFSCLLDGFRGMNRASRVTVTRFVKVFFFMSGTVAGVNVRLLAGDADMPGSCAAGGSRSPLLVLGVLALSDGSVVGGFFGDGENVERRRIRDGMLYVMYSIWCAIFAKARSDS